MICLLLFPNVMVPIEILGCTSWWARAYKGQCASRWQFEGLTIYDILWLYFWILCFLGLMLRSSYIPCSPASNNVSGWDAESSPWVSSWSKEYLWLRPWGGWACWPSKWRWGRGACWRWSQSGCCLGWYGSDLTCVFKWYRFPVQKTMLKPVGITSQSLGPEMASGSVRAAGFWISCQTTLQTPWKKWSKLFTPSHNCLFGTCGRDWVGSRFWQSKQYKVSAKKKYAARFLLGSYIWECSERMPNGNAMVSW